jgi:putative membrane protein
MLPLLHGTFDVITFWSWYPDPVVLFGVIAASWLYLRAIGPQRHRFEDSAPVERKRVMAFFLGLAAIVLALLSPLEPLADDYLLSAHMIQHLLLTITAPPLIIYGIPVWVWAAFRRREHLWRVWRVLTLPLLAFMLFHLPFSLAHVPWFYNLTLQSTTVHVAEHFVFTAAAFLVWWPVLAPGRSFGQLPAGLSILYLFAQTIPGQLVGALITVADHPLYQTYADASRVLGISVMADQQAGGLIMWVGTGTFYLSAMSIVFFRWARSEDARERERWVASPAAQKPATLPADHADVAPSRAR